RSGQPVVLAVGMKGLGWPEFYVPASALPAGGLTKGQDAASDASLRDATLAFVYETVTRYRDHSTLISWQVENEPFNRAGPQRMGTGQTAWRASANWSSARESRRGSRKPRQNPGSRDRIAM